MTEFSTDAMKRMIKNNTSKRVSEDAAKELRLLVENHAQELAEEAVKEAEDNDRVTVRDSDVVEAIRGGDL